MRLHLLPTILLIIASCGLAYGQTTTTILDFEGAATTTTFQSFGGAVEGVVRSPIENPDKTGINTSDSVMTHVKPGDAPTWGGAFSNPVPATPVDLTTSGSTIAMKVWMPSGGIVRLKLEESTTSAGNWELDATAATGGQWVELTWDPATPSDAGDGVVAAGNSYNKVVVFFTFGTGGDGNDYTYYFDDLVVNSPTPPPATGAYTVLDFEGAATNTDFQSFGGAVEGVVRSAIENPDKSGINTSDSVMIHVKPGDAPTWGGAFSNPNGATAVDLTSEDTISMKVWMPTAGIVRLKLEESTTGAGNWELDQTASAGGTWVELKYDAATASAAGDGVIAAGNIYNKVVVFFDFGTAGDGNDYTYYWDDLVVGQLAPPPPPPAGGAYTVLDFENASTNTDFQSFGGAVEGVVRSAIENPDKSGINTSDSVMIHIKPGDSPEWGGAFSNPNSPTAVDLTSEDTISMKVWMPAAGVVRLKLEESTTGAGNWELDQTASAGGTWVQLKYDAATPSAAGDGVIAAGNVYNKVVVFFDFGTAGDGNDYTYYWDDLVVGVETATTSIKDKLVADLFSIAPNPSRDIVTLSMEASPVNSSQVIVTDLQGKVVHSATMEAGVSEYQIRVSSWTAGLYMVQLRNKNGIGVQKLLVE